MIQIKKTILTLVALFALTAGAWAEEVLLTTITAADNSSFKSGSQTFGDVATVTITGDYLRNDGSHGGWYCQGSNLTATISVAAANGANITSVKFYTAGGGSAEDKDAPFEVTTTTVTSSNITTYLNGNSIGSYGVSKIEVYGTAEPPITVEWNAASKTGTFDMPGGNVTLEPEYYPQATLTAAPTAADGAKATTDDLLVSGGTVATITGSDPAAPQGTLMYYVSLTNMSTEALLALDADDWVAEPTAAGITQKCGAFVYYYVKGNDSTDDALNFSDGDISSDNVLLVPIYPAPTYSVTFADGIDEPTLWTADPNTDVTKGQTVTVTYTGSKKILGVKAEKIGGAEGHALSASAVGEIVGSDGKAYAVADKDNLPSGVTAVAMVAYKSGSNGLAIQLNASPVEKNWADAKTYAEGLTAVPGGTWRLPSKVDWQNMFVGCAVSGDASAGDNMSPIAGFKAKIAATGITWQSADYWSSTESGSYAWTVGVNLNGSNPRAEFTEFTTSIQIPILGCLAF